MLAAPEVFADGVREVLAGLGLTAPVGVVAERDAVAEGAAWLTLAPVFEGDGPSSPGPREPIDRMIGK